MNKKDGSNTAKKQPTPKKRLKRGKGVPFKKNNPQTGERDERINRNGPPRTSITLRNYVLDIFAEEGKNKSGEKMSILRAMLLKMAINGTPADRSELLDRGFGKVPDELMLSMNDIKKIIEFLPPDMIQRLAKGESISDVIIQFITSHSDGTSSPA